MFISFNVPLPEYEVLTPQTNASFTLRSLTVAEEERMKGSLVTPIKMTEHLNQCIYDAIVTKPENITDITEFLKNTTPRDRDALLYGLYHVTYEEIRNYEITCMSCQKTFAVTVNASDTFTFNGYPAMDILTKRIPVPLKIMKNVSAVIKQPTLFDEITSYKELMLNPSFTLDIIAECLYLEKFVQIKEDGTEITYDEKADIIDAYKSLPAKDKRILQNAYRDNFGVYGMILKMRTQCTHCGHEDQHIIDLVDQFFRMVYSA